jgi:hypothetical protein
VRKYSDIYNKLVTDDDDFVGMVAYAIYKKNKIEHIKNIKEEHSREPTDDDLTSFHSSSCLKTSIEGYKKMAVESISRFANNL